MKRIGKLEVVLVFFLLIALVAVFWMLKKENIAREGNHKISEFIGTKKDFSRQFDFKKDSDNDGLKDWEEALWKTDPQNPDSDGDGTPDGEEVAEGRNPAVPGPNDSLPFTFLPPAKSGGDGIVFKVKKEVTRKEKEVPGGAEKKKKEEKKPFILSVSPSQGGVGTEVKIIGSGFTPKGNTVYAGYAVIKNLPSPDGKTLTFRVEPDLPNYLKNLDYSLVYWFYVENANGLSNYGNFRLSF